MREVVDSQEIENYFSVTPQQIVSWNTEYFGTEFYITKNEGDLDERYRIRMETGKSNDLLYFLRHSPEGVFEKSEFFPKTYEVLGKAEGFFILHENSNIANAFIVVNDRVIEIKRSFLGSNPADQEFSNRKYFDTGMLPEELRLGFYSHINGLIVLKCPKFTDVIGGYLLPLPRGEGIWPDIGDFSSRYSYDEYAVISYLRERTGASKNARFLSFLNTYRDNPRDKSSRFQGDYLFVSSESPNKEIYHIKDGDYENVRIIKNYCEAIDLYCEHVLLRHEGSFNFLPFTEKL